MYPTLFTIGRFSIPSYTVLLDLGIILGLVITYFEGRRLLRNTEIALDLGLWTVIGGILGGRIGHVLAHVSAYSENWLGALRIWEGGLSFHGAFLGGLFVLGVFTLAQRRREEPHTFWELADVVTLGIALGLVFGWAGCLLRGCAYGIPGEGFGYASLPDIYGIETSRFATQAFGLGVALVLTLVFWLLRRRWPFSGASFLMLVLLTFASQFFLESKRYDEAIYVGPWRLQQVLDLALALVAAVGLLVLWWQARADEGEAEKVEETAGTEDGEEAVQAEDLVGAALEAAQAEEGEQAIPIEEPVEEAILVEEPAEAEGEEPRETEDEAEAG